ncbi:unnamed protein product [Meloidogyne enterolobii]|uniref:Uncharacterized protein n=1 Tax=Meloidogyne enterolobii TaxID=390850 RepID=A0ACB0Y6Z3_MELEN
MRFFSYEDIDIHDEDVISLRGHGWLTDNIIRIVYATQSELIKYESDQIDTLLNNIGVNPDKWNLFIYNDSNNPNQVYSGTHWSLILFNPNQKNFLLFDPARGFENYDNVSEPVYSFVSKMTNYLKLTSNQPIRRYTQTPFMEISGDCGIYIIEYSRIIFKHISGDFKVDQDLNFKFDGYLREGLKGIEKARLEWQKTILTLTEKEKRKL